MVQFCPRFNLSFSLSYTHYHTLQDSYYHCHKNTLDCRKVLTINDENQMTFSFSPGAVGSHRLWFMFSVDDVF